MQGDDKSANSQGAAKGLSCSFSVVIPCFNEQENLPVLLEQLQEKLEAATHGSWEVLLVDDGSTDATAAIIVKYNNADPRIRGVFLSRNFGHQNALTAGLSFASGDVIGVMDADLQDPVDVLIECYDKLLAEKMDVVFAERRKRQGAAWKNLAYRLFYRLMRHLSDHPWPLDAGDFCVLNRRTLKILVRLPERVRIFRGIRSWIGLRQDSVIYERPKRFAGQSKYSLAMLSGLALESIIGFSTAPLRLAVFLGLSMGVLTMVLAVILVLNRFVPGFNLFGYWIGANPGITTVVMLINLVSSLLFLCLGIIGEYVAILIKEIKMRPGAIVADVTFPLKRRDDESPVTVPPLHIL